MALLARRQSLRPDPSEILARLGVRITPMPSTPPPVSLYFFVNRTKEQALLRSCLEKSRHSPVVIEMTGNAGIGKSALCDLFTEQAIRETSAVVLRARCHEREAISYNAFDGIMDDLRTHIETQNMNEVGLLLPLDWDLLVDIFPSLGFGEYQATGVAVETDAPAYRLLAFRAFRDVLYNISQKRPVVLIIDDAQWADRDSAAILSEVLSKSFGLLLLVVRRPVEDPGPMLHLVSKISQERPFVEYHHLDIQLLSDSDCHQLAASLLPEGYPEDFARRVASEASGSPFLVCQMAQHLTDLAISGKPLTAAISVQSVVKARIRFLPRNLRRVLELLCVAGRPLGPAVLQSLFPDSHVEAGLHKLRRLHLIQLTPSVGIDAPHQWGIYHDCIRQAVFEELDEHRATHLHLALARSLQEAQDEDFESI
ncbi:MAG TPA: AAA family ATPase, partial [Polyangiaceae bacterium]|nr:AAA family ATPase [Polyangiaceae bacterium]